MPYSSIDMIPDDVLRDIFTHCLPDYRWEATLSPLEAPVLLTHVCQKWRRVAVDFPFLWTWLRWNVQRISLNEAKVDVFIEATKRAKAAPLNLELKLEIRNRPSDRKGVDRRRPIPDILSRLLSNTTPQSITRLVLVDIPIGHLHAIPENSFPSLERLVLRLDGIELERFSWTTKGPTIQAFSSAPKLTHVAMGSTMALDYPDTCYLPYKIPLPWSQLTHFLEINNVKGMSRFFWDILPQCHKLRYLYTGVDEEDIHEDGIDNWRAAPRRCVDSLVALSISFWAWDHGDFVYPAILDAYRFPNLKALLLEGAHMDLEDDKMWTPELKHRFLSNFASLGANLTYLSINHAHATPSTLRQILACMPHLKTLDAPIYDDGYAMLFETLRWDETQTQPDIIPNLETLILEVGCVVEECAENMYPDLFHDFLNSRIRSRPHSPFKKVIFYYDQDDVVDDDDVLYADIAQEFGADGLVIETRMVAKERRDDLDHHWMQRDPDLQDWPEVESITL